MGELKGSGFLLMAISFIHAADIHLDSPLKGLERYENAPIDRIRGATRCAFSRLIDLAIEKAVDFVLISGDLYDGDWRDYNTGLFLVRELRRLRDMQIPVILIAGNHDAANKMTRTLSLPDNVRFLTHNRPETVMLEKLGVAIHGQSFAKAAVLENLAATYPGAVKGNINIGLLHTAMNGVDGHERYAPCTLDELKSRGYHYWALGHVHTRQVLCKEPIVVFAGNVQGRHARETGPKGCLLVTVRSDETIETVFERLDRVRWERGHIDLTNLESESELWERAAETFDRLLASEPEPDVMLAVRLTLDGTSTLHGRVLADRDRLAAELRNVAAEKGCERIWIEKIEIEARPVRSMAQLDGPFEDLLEVIEQLNSDPTSMSGVVDELAELRRKLPGDLIHDADGPRLDDVQWLLSLMGQVQPLLLDLLTNLESTATK